MPILRPFPNEADREEARRFVDSRYDDDPTVCRTWLENNRAKLVSYAADAAMQKRMNEEASRHREMGRGDKMRKAAAA
jgi:antitoxin component HigA of HigAB toxin-antitoxin module